MGEIERVKLWEKNIYNAVLDISDNSFQSEVWLGKNPNLVSSYEEVISVLFDDNDFVNYTEYYKNIHGEDRLYKLFFELIQMINNYQNPGNDKLVLKDPNWIFITNKAKEVVRYFNK